MELIRRSEKRRVLTCLRKITARMVLVVILELAWLHVWTGWIRHHVLMVMVEGGRMIDRFFGGRVLAVALLLKIVFRVYATTFHPSS